MKYLLLVFAMLVAFPVHAVTPEPDNSAMFFCRDKHGYTGLDSTTTADWMKFASCVNDIKSAVRKQEERELWDFLEANPRYRVPGQSLNKCFGKPKERALDRIETGPDGSTTAYYKDKIVQCYK